MLFVVNLVLSEIIKLKMWAMLMGYVLSEIIKLKMWAMLMGYENCRKTRENPVQAKYALDGVFAPQDIGQSQRELERSTANSVLFR